MKTKIFQTGGEQDSFFNDYASLILDNNSQAEQPQSAETEQAATPEEGGDFIKNLQSYDDEQSKTSAEDQLRATFDDYISKIDKRLAMLSQSAEEGGLFDDISETDYANHYDTRVNATPAFGRPASGNASGKAQQAYNFFLNKGYSKEAAAGLVGNITHESQFNVGAVGDGGKAKGYAQWHPDRYNALSRKFDLSTDQGNLEAIDYELHTSEGGAYEKLKNATSPEQAAAIVDKEYERSAGLSTRQRMASARQIYK